MYVIIQYHVIHFILAALKQAIIADRLLAYMAAHVDDYWNTSFHYPSLYSGNVDWTEAVLTEESIQYTIAKKTNLNKCDINNYRPISNL